MKTLENILKGIVALGFFIVWVIGGAMVSISLYVLIGLDIIKGDK